MRPYAARTCTWVSARLVAQQRGVACVIGNQLARRRRVLSEALLLLLLLRCAAVAALFSHSTSQSTFRTRSPGRQIQTELAAANKGRRCEKKGGETTGTSKHLKRGRVLSIDNAEASNEFEV